MPHRHVGEHELDALEVGDPLAELLALLDVVEGDVEGALGEPDGLRADGDPGVVQGAEGDLQALARRADDPVARDAHVVEVELAGG